MRFSVVRTKKELEACFTIRKQVFIQEQKVPLSIEIDEKEDDSVHFLVEDNQKFIAAGRMYSDAGGAIIGRIAVLKEARGRGVGFFLMGNIIEFASTQGFAFARLGAQQQALEFYRKLGFKVCSDMYLDAGIVHYKMMRNLI